MKWKHDIIPSVGTERVIKKFLILSMHLGGSEWRWLEGARILQRVKVWAPMARPCWINIKFLNDEESVENC